MNEGNRRGPLTIELPLVAARSPDHGRVDAHLLSAYPTAQQGWSGCGSTDGGHSAATAQQPRHSPCSSTPSSSRPCSSLRRATKSRATQEIGSIGTSCPPMSPVYETAAKGPTVYAKSRVRRKTYAKSNRAPMSILRAIGL
jgi:hypothetical protein